MVAEVSRPAAGALWCNSAPWLTNLEAFSITYFAASRAGLWTVCSTANRVWRGGNRTHMFSRHRVFCQLSAPCLQLVCECHTVSPNECCFSGRRKLAKEKREADFFFLFSFFISFANWNFLIRLQRSRSVGSRADATGGLFHPRCTSTLLHLASEKRSLPNRRCWNWREISLTNRNPSEGKHPSLGGWTLQTSLRRAQANSSG